MLVSLPSPHRTRTNPLLLSFFFPLPHISPPAKQSQAMPAISVSLATPPNHCDHHRWLIPSKISTAFCSSLSLRRKGKRRDTLVVLSGQPFAELSVSEEDEWIKKLPDRKKPLYSHSLPCIEAWLRILGFQQSKQDRAVWVVEKKEWHAELLLDFTDLYIKYLKNGPGNLERDVERRFSYALSREDIENAVLGGP